MNLDGKTLNDWLAGCSDDDFPRGFDYKARFQHAQNTLNAFVHPIVTVAALLTDGGFLTDHGPEHIKTVIARASNLIRFGHAVNLSPYEVYIILSAIHVHDLGNALGRESHELLAERVMKIAGPLLGDDTVEQWTIYNIAQAHGGQVGSDRDKIGKLPAIEYVLGQRIRSRILASLLRFGDELADDRTRASRYLIEAGKIPEPSLVYHKYAYALHSVTVSEDAVRLDFQLDSSDATRKFGKGNKRVYLLDEIYLRTMKMHRERMYCMRFLRPLITIDRIDVSIRVFGEGYSKEVASFDYRLEETGYPSEKNTEIFALCPSLKNNTYGSPLTGAALRSFVLGQRQNEAINNDSR
jgi:hypothetical protein